jgi:hypothetical protein
LKKQIVDAEKCLTAAIERNSLKVDGSPRGAASPGNVAMDLCYEYIF